MQIQHNPKITKLRHSLLALLACFRLSFLPAQLQTTWLGSLVLVLTALPASRGTELGKHFEIVESRVPSSRTLEALMRSNEDGYGVSAEAVIAALFAVHACHQPWFFFIGDISPKTETQNSRIKRVVLGIGFSIAGNEKTKTKKKTF